MADTRAPLPMRPSGMSGRIFGWAMEALNGRSYSFALGLLALQGDSDILEIGFGTGRMIELMLEITDGRIAGVDATPTMVDIARRRARIRRAGPRIDLRTGTDQNLDWLSFAPDRAVALHSFQFWPDPARTVRHLFDCLSEAGKLVLVLRDHGARPPDWLPNPISRSGEESERTQDLLAEAGFVTRSVCQGRMTALVADKPISEGM